MAEVHDKGQSCHVLPTSLHAVFFHLGAPLHAGAALAEAEVLFLSIRNSQRGNGDDRCVSNPPCFF